MQVQRCIGSKFFFFLKGLEVMQLFQKFYLYCPELRIKLNVLDISLLKLFLTWFSWSSGNTIINTTF